MHEFVKCMSLNPSVDFFPPILSMELCPTPESYGLDGRLGISEVATCSCQIVKTNNRDHNGSPRVEVLERVLRHLSAGVQL
jgi:hypothetical protein